MKIYFFTKPKKQQNKPKMILQKNIQKRKIKSNRQGFTLVEVMVATGLLSFGFVVMFGLHLQAIRSNKHAKRMTDCTYLAQSKMERLMMLRWTLSSRPLHLKDNGTDGTSSTAPWSFLPQPSSGNQPPPINASNSSDTKLGPKRYYVSWDILEMDSTPTWLQIRVRCQYKDSEFGTWHGTTVSSYRYRDK
jgi:prepilin-type N-terminal cleavage/methylation domain-containing protein